MFRSFRVFSHQVTDVGCPFPDSKQKCLPYGWPRSGTKKEPKPKLLSPDISGGVSVFHVMGWGPKKFVCPSKPRESNLFGGISRDFAGISRKRPKSLRKKCLGSIFGPYNRHSQGVCVCVCVCVCARAHVSIRYYPRITTITSITYYIFFSFFLGGGDFFLKMTLIITFLHP